MKKRILNYVLIAILCSAITQNALGMHIATKMAKYGIAGLCSLTELFITFAPMIDTVILHPHDIRAEKLKDVKSDAPEIITNYITQIASKHNIENVKVILNGDTDNYSTNDNSNIIYVPTKHAQKLESLLHNTNRNPQEEKELNKEVGTIHHELTHNIMRSSKYAPMYDATIGIIGAVATSATLTHIIKKHIPYVNSNFALHNGFKLARSGVTFLVAFNLMHMNMYKKYDELKADDGIPNQKKLLEAQAEEFKECHAAYLGCINIIKEKADYKTIIYSTLPDDQFNRKQLFAMKTFPKTWFDKPLVMDTIFHASSEHPSNLRRQLRFEKRIKSIDAEIQQ